MPVPERQRLFGTSEELAQAEHNRCLERVMKARGSAGGAPP
jgi:hypothetical protein